MSRRVSSKNSRKEDDFGSDIDCEVFLSQDEDEHKDGQDVQLGSRLEDELNRSIEKMRQMEDSDKMDDNLSIENLLDSDTSETNRLLKSRDLSVRECNSDELLEDIEMPSLGESTCESAELVSISSGSPPSHVKQHSSFWSRGSGTSFSDTATRGRATSSSLQITSSPEKKDMDLCEKIALLSAPKTQRCTTLVSFGEDGAVRQQVASEGSKSSEDENQEDAMDLLAEKSCNMTSSPLSGDHNTMLSFEMIDLENMNDDLISSILMANSPIKEPIAFNLQSTAKDLQKIITQVVNTKISENIDDGKDGIEDSNRISKLNQANPMLNGASTVDVNSPLPLNHRVTLGGELLDSFEMNDSLLTSLHMAKSPILVDGQDLSSLLMEYKREIVKNAPESQSQSDNVKLNNPSYEKLAANLDTTQSLGNKSKSVNDLPKETTVNQFLSLEKTFSCSEKLLDGRASTASLQAPGMALNSTYDFKRSKSTLSCTDLKDNTYHKDEMTFIVNGNPKTLVNDGANQTFCAKRTQLVNTTFDTKELPAVDTTFNLKASQANTTFDRKDVITDGMDSPLNRSEQNDGGNLNVTFEKGEYRITSLNETVNLMDAEENVLKLILDSTPLKPSKIPPGASSTPKDPIRLDAAAKRTVTKDPAQTFLHRMSLGVRKTCENTGEDKEKKDNGEQASGPNSAMPGLKMGYVSQQSVTNQLRRLHSGLGRTASGPMRALPLTSMSVGSTGDKSQKDSGSQSDLDGIRALDNTAQGEAGNGKQKLPSFGSISSVDSDRPGTPDVYKAGSAIAVTPDVFRPSSCSMNPRITSTPATKIGGSHSNVVTMDGPAPTPISAPPSRSRFGTTSVSSCSLVERDNPSWEGLSHASTKSDMGSLNTPAKKVSALPVRPSRMYSPASLAAVATPEEPEEHLNGQNISEDSGIKAIDDEEANKCIPDTAYGNEVLETNAMMEEKLHLLQVITQSADNVKEEKQNKSLEESENVIKVEEKMNATSENLNRNNPTQQMDSEAASAVEIQRVKSCQDTSKINEWQISKEVHVNPMDVKQDGLSISICKEAVADIPLSKSSCEDQIDCGGHNVEAASCTPVVSETPISISQGMEMVSGQGSSLNGTISYKKETASYEMETGGQYTEDNGIDKVDEPQNVDHAEENVLEKTGISPDRDQVKNVLSSSKSAASKGKTAAASRRSTTRVTARAGDNKASLPSKILVANKENIAKNDLKSKDVSQPKANVRGRSPALVEKLPSQQINASSQSKVNVRGRSPALKEKLPSQQIKAPLSSQTLKMPKAEDQKKTAVQKRSLPRLNDQNKDAIQRRMTTKSHDQQQGMLLRKPTSKSDDNLQKKGLAKIERTKMTMPGNGKMPPNAGTPVKKSVNANSHKVESKELINKVNDAPLKNAVNKDVPVTNASRLKPPQSIPVSKLPLGPQIPSGVPVRGMVKSSSSCDPSSFKNLPSRLPSIRPPNSSLPVVRGKSLSSSSIRSGIALPSTSTSRLERPKRP